MMIEILQLTRKFGDKIAVDNISMKVNDGEIFGLLGPNGAGKTTTLRILAGLISPTSGGAVVDGFSVNNKESLNEIRKRLGLLPEVPGLYETLSAYRNIDFYGELYDVPKEEREKRIEELLKGLEIWEERSKPVATFSKGMKQKIAIARALIHEPRVLLLDEPMSGLDPSARKTVKDFIRNLKKKGRTIFLNTHNLDDAQQLCDRVAVINTRLIAVDSPENLGKGLWKPKLAITMRRIEDVNKAVSLLSEYGEIEQMGKKIEVSIKNAEEDNPKILHKLLSSSIDVVYAEEVKHTLEESYLELLRRVGAR